MNTTVIKGSLSGDRISEERNALQVAALIVLTAAAYWPSTQALWTVWTDPDFGAGHAHGLLVGLLSLWTLVRTRDAVARAPARPALWAYPLLFIGSLASLVFWRAGIQTLYMLLLPALALMAVLCVLGTRVARAVAFPLGYLYFSMPAWGLLGHMLQVLTIRAVAVLCPLIGIPAQVIGNIVNLPRVGAFEITPACSGDNFLVVGLAVAALIGELTRASIRRRMWLLTVVAVGAIVSNWLRAVLIIGIGYATNLHFTLATRDHVLFGWIIFAAMLLGYVWWATAPGTSPVENLPDATVFPTLPTQRASRGRAAFIVAVLILCAAPVWAYVASPGPPGARLPPPPMPAAPHGWRGPLASPDAAWEPIFVGEHSQQRVDYQEGAEVRTVEVLAIGYARQGQGQELVNEGNSLLGDRGLKTVAGSLASGGGQTFRELTVVDANGQHSVVWWVYDIGGHTFVTPLYSQLWYAMISFGRTPYSAIFAFRTACEPSCDEARSALQRFVQTMSPTLSAKIQK